MVKYFGLNPTLRLTKPAEYKQVFANPSRSTDKYFTVLAIKNNQGHPRLGLAVAKKHIRKAVDRNLIKRIVRESFRLSQHNLNGMDFVVLARSHSNQTTLYKLNQSLQKHWLTFKNQCNTCSSPS